MFLPYRSVSITVTCREQLLNAGWSRQKALFLNFPFTENSTRAKLLKCTVLIERAAKILAPDRLVEHATSTFSRFF